MPRSSWPGRAPGEAQRRPGGRGRRPGRGAGPGGPRTKDLTRRLQPGEIAVIDHADIDRVAAEGLIGAEVGAVLNAARSITGRYPNGGPIRLVEAGILLVDDLGPDLMTTVEEGDVLVVDRDGTVRRGSRTLAKGAVRTVADVTDAMEQAAREHRRGARALRREHARVHPARGQDHLRPARAARSAHPVQGPARDRRRARPRLQDRPGGAQGVSARVRAGADRCRRWRRRPPRSRIRARHHHRRLRLGQRPRRPLRRASCCTTCTRTAGLPGGRTSRRCTSWPVATTRSSWPRA